MQGNLDGSRLKRCKRYFAVLLVATPIFFALAMSYDICFNQNALVKNLTVALKAHRAAVVYFGDSVVVSSGDRDWNKSGIDELLRQKTDHPVVTVASYGYSPVVYSSYLDVIVNSSHRPDLVIIPLNLRSFSEEWFSRPDSQFYLDRLRAELVYKGFSATKLAEYFRYKFTGTLARETSVWLNSDVSYGALSLGRRNLIHQRSAIPSASLDSADAAHAFTNELRLQFSYHYMNQIGDHHPMFAYLDAIIGKCAASGIPVMFYLTPIDYEDGTAYVGEAFTRRLDENRETVLNYFKSRKALRLDLSRTLPARYFIDKKFACEHLNEDGRKHVAEHLWSFIVANRLLDSFPAGEKTGREPE